MDPRPHQTPLASSSAPKRRGWLRFGLRLLGPILLVIVIVRLKDGAAIGRTLIQASLLPVLLAAALNAAALHLKVLRWDALLRTRAIHYPRRRAYAAFLSSLFVGMLTPGRVGDALRAQYLKRDLDVPYSEGLASVVMDRVCDLYVLVIFASLGVVRFSQVIAGDLAVAAWAAVGLTILGPLVLLVPGLADAVMRRAWQKLGAAEPTGLARFLAALRAQVGPSLFITVPLTVGAFLINYGQAWLMGKGLHLSLSFYDVMCLVAIASLLGLLPISVSGVGVRELFFALAFPVLGYPAEVGVSFSLLFFAVNHLLLIGAGFVSFQLFPPPTLSEAAQAPAS